LYTEEISLMMSVSGNNDFIEVLPLRYVSEYFAVQCPVFANRNE